MRLIDADNLKKELAKCVARNNAEHKAVIDFDFETLIDDADTITKGSMTVRQLMDCCVARYIDITWSDEIDKPSAVTIDQNALTDDEYGMMFEQLMGQRIYLLEAHEDRIKISLYDN